MQKELKKANPLLALHKVITPLAERKDEDTGRVKTDDEILKEALGKLTGADYNNMSKEALKDKRLARLISPQAFGQIMRSTDIPEENKQALIDGVRENMERLNLTIGNLTAENVAANIRSLKTSLENAKQTNDTAGISRLTREIAGKQQYNSLRFNAAYRHELNIIKPPKEKGDSESSGSENESSDSQDATNDDYGPLEID